MLPWDRMDDFLLRCGRVRNPQDFSKIVLDEINALIPFDQGRLYFLNDNGEVYDEHLLGVEDWVVKEYHEYYSKVDNGAFSTKAIAAEFSKHPESMLKVENCLYNHTSYQSCKEFLAYYIQPHQINYSFGMALRDPQNTLKALFSLDRVGRTAYSEEEINIMRHIRPHLDNLHQNFFVPLQDEPGIQHNNIVQDQALTAREQEIASLLTKGISPTSISRKLCISVMTVHKHIAHLHTKLNVSTRQELIVKLLSQG